ncbi:hypothetical protein pb186bvf_001220 [Paramecium bursaria]
MALQELFFIHVLLISQLYACILKFNILQIIKNNIDIKSKNIYYKIQLGYRRDQGIPNSQKSQINNGNISCKNNQKMPKRHDGIQVETRLIHKINCVVGDFKAEYRLWKDCNQTT